MSFELFIAGRYLRAKRKQAAISLITVISILGVAAGVMALVIALAINAGFRSTLQRNLLGATAHVTVLEKQPEFGIGNWRELIARFRSIPHVDSAYPSLYGTVFLRGPLQSSGAVLKGVPLDRADSVPDVLRNLKQGSLRALTAPGKLPGIILGARLAESTGMLLHSNVTVISPYGEPTPFGPKIIEHRFRVVGIFESGFFELDSAWAYTTLPAAQVVLSLGDVANAVELKLDDPYAAPEVARQTEKLAGPALAATHWQEQNRQLLSALKMERVVTVITIGLIQLVAALNILITLVMMVMEKQKDIALLVSMGARSSQVRRIFMLQGVLIGVVGTVLGLLLGYTICYLADHYRWVTLDATVYALSYVPFEPRWLDALWISAVAVGVSFLATLYPSRTAARVVPVEALRYE